jgi:hypothetical protein
MDEATKPLDIGAVVTYQGSIGFYHGHRYEVVRRFQDSAGEWRYDLEPIKGLFGARQSSLVVE